jgi:hypothetical protein
MPSGLQAELKQNIPFTSREQEAYLDHSGRAEVAARNG